MSRPVIFVLAEDFDKTRLGFDDPTTVQYPTGTSANLSYMYYLDEDGQKCELYLGGAPNFTFGVAKDYAYGKDSTEADRANPANLKGYKITYMLTDKTRVNAPNAAEKATIDAIAAITRAAIAHAHDPRILKILEDMIPAQSVLLQRARDRKLPHGGIKPIITDAYVSDEKDSKKKVVDPTKPKRVYAKLWSFKDKKTGKIVVKTKIYVNGKEVDPATLIDRRGEIQPVFQFKSIWWGDHKTKPYGGGMQYKLSEGIFVPQPDGAPQFLAAKAAASAIAVEAVEEDDAAGAAADPHEALMAAGGPDEDGGGDDDDEDDGSEDGAAEDAGEAPPAPAVRGPIHAPPKPAAKAAPRPAPKRRAQKVRAKPHAR